MNNEFGDFMKKSFLSAVLFSGIISSLFSLSRTDVSKVLEKVDGYYVNVVEDLLIKITSNDSGLRIAKTNYNLQTQKVYSNDFEVIKYKEMNDSEFQKFLETVEIEKNQLKSFEYKNLKYTFLSKDEKQTLEIMEANAKVFLDGLCTEYLDDSTRLRFVLYKENNQLKLKTYKKGGKATVRDVQIVNRSILNCEDYNISISSKMIRFEPAKEKNKYTSVFDTGSKKCLSESNDKSQRQNTTVPFPKTYIDIFNENERTKSFDLYRDEYGYLCVESNGKKTIIIEGASEDNNPINITFTFKGDNIKDDPEAVERYFGKFPQDFNVSRHVNQQQNLNGLWYYNNITASSSLKEKNRTYSPDQTLKVYDPFAGGYGQYGKVWVKDNIPWVEGKAGDGIGESIEMDLIPGAAHNDSGFYFVILNGYVDPLRPYLFKQNNRIKKALIETNTGFKKEITFNDAVEFNSVYIEEKTKHIKLTILEVYKGTKYSDTCITAFDLYDYWWEK